MLTQTIGFIGAGQMARALARGFVQAGIVPAEKVAACDSLPEATVDFLRVIPGAKIAINSADLATQADVVVLAVKPQSMQSVMEEIGGKLGDRLVISVAAGVTLEKLCQGLKTDRVVRVMPNTPALVGQGASAYACAQGASEEDGKVVGQLLSAVGRAFAVEEKLLDAVTGLSGSGPAFVYVMIEALSDGGVRVGLPRDVAMALAAQTVLGAAEMVLSTGEHPAVLKDRVASPGGTTIAGLAVLEDHGLRAALIAAVEAATRRSTDLGKR